MAALRPLRPFRPSALAERQPESGLSITEKLLTHIYRPALDKALTRPKQLLLIAALVFAISLWPITQLGEEFIPQMNEGDLLYLPSALSFITCSASFLEFEGLGLIFVPSLLG